MDVMYTNAAAAWPGLVNIWRVIWKGEKRRQKGTDEKIKARVDNFTDALKVTAADAQREQAAVTDQIQALGRVSKASKGTSKLRSKSVSLRRNG